MQKAKKLAFPRHLDRYDIHHSASCTALLNQTHSALFWRRCFRSVSSVKFLMALSRLLATSAAAVDSWTTHTNHAVICIHHKAAVDSWTTHTNHGLLNSTHEPCSHLHPSQSCCGLLNSTHEPCSHLHPSYSCCGLLNNTHEPWTPEQHTRTMQSSASIIQLLWTPEQHTWTMDSWTTHTNHAVICIHHTAAVDSWTTHTNHGLLNSTHEPWTPEQHTRTMQSSASIIQLLWTPEQHTWTMDSWTTHTNHAVICIHHKAAVDSWTTHTNHAVIYHHAGAVDSWTTHTNHTEIYHHAGAVDSWTTHMNHTEIYHHAGAVDSWTTHMNNTLPRSKQSRGEQHSSSSTGLGIPQMSATCWRHWAGLLCRSGATTFCVEVSDWKTTYSIPPPPTHFTLPLPISPSQIFFLMMPDQYYSEHPSYRRQNNWHVDRGPLNKRIRKRTIQKFTIMQELWTPEQHIWTTKPFAPIMMLLPTPEQQIMIPVSS